MKCPYCAEEILDEAIKCKHCGEWLDKSKAPSPARENQDSQTLDNSTKKLYRYLIRGEKKPIRSGLIVAADQEEAKPLILEGYEVGYTIDERHGLELQPEGKFSCPRCSFKYADCSRDIGCAALVVIFISLGLGLMMIPFLPHKCECKACGHKWES